MPNNSIKQPKGPATETILAQNAEAIRALSKRVLLTRSVLDLLKRGLISTAEAKLRFPEVFSDDGGAP